MGEAKTKDKKLGTILGFAALAVAIAAVVLWNYHINQVAIPENRTLFVLFFLTAPVLGISAFVLGTRWFGGIAAIPGIVIGLFLPFTVAISRQEVAENPIAVGDTIPHFVAIDDHGNRFDSTDLEGSPILIKFFRAHW